MAFEFKLDEPDEDANYFDLFSKVSEINNKSENEHSIMRRAQSTVSKMIKLDGVSMSFPNVGGPLQMPYVQNVAKNQEKVNLFTPYPPVIRTEAQKMIYKMIKKFSGRYQHIWILISSPKHPVTAPFSQIFQQEMLSNVNHNLQNMLIAEDYARIFIFTREGIYVKVMMDYQSYDKKVKYHISDIQKDPRVLEIYIENSLISGMSVIPTKKIKSVPNLVNFIQNQVKSDVQRSRKDVPFFNFIHSNSGPDLFNRRTIMKNCICSKTQAQLLDSHFQFVQMLQKQTTKQRQISIKQIRNRNSYDLIVQMQRANSRFDKWDIINKQFSRTFQHYIKAYHPIQKQEETFKKQVYNWVINQYCLESAIYPLINNTIRYASNNQKVNPISTFVKYLFEGLRYYFTARYRQINFMKVYRGAKVSLTEQRSFIPGRYMWNLGFMSTSIDKNVAYGFISSMPKDIEKYEKVLMVIELSSLTTDIEYLKEQEGFFMMNNVYQIRQNVIQQEKQVLFNPLNMFKIINWNDQTKELVLRYAPHLEILDKKKKGSVLEEDEINTLRSITNLKDTDFDKGQQFLEQGNPISAIKYYEQSDETGSTLSFVQKANYIKGLIEVGDLQKIEVLLEEAIQQQKNAQKQMLDPIYKGSVTSISVEKVADSVQSLALYVESSNFEQAEQKIQIATAMTIQKSIQIPSQQILLLQVKTYIEMAKVKYQVSETIESIQQSIRSLKMIDELANINFGHRLWEIGHEIRKIQGFFIKPQMTNLKSILEENHFMRTNIQQFRKDTLRRIGQVRKQDIVEGGQKNVMRGQSFNPVKTSSKQTHQKAESMLETYFKKRDVRTEMQNLQQRFVFAFWEVEKMKIDSRSLSQKQAVGQMERLKLCTQRLMEVKNDYKSLFEHEVQAYDVLYRNIYKTSINVQACLKSYKGNLYYRYWRFIEQKRKNTGDSSIVARVLWKYGQILMEYGQIIQKPLMKDKDRQTQSEKQGYKKIKQAGEMITRIQQKDAKVHGSNKMYTHEKTQINRTISRYLRSKTMQKQKARKLAIMKETDAVKKTNMSSVSTNASEKSQIYSQLIKTIDTNRQLHESDTNINQPLFSIKDACDKIQVLNQSQDILVPNQSYSERLKSCRNQFENVINTIDKYKQKKRMQRNINMAKLYLLMAENQFKLGLVSAAKDYLKLSNKCLQRTLKIQEVVSNQKIRRIDQQKLLLGNSIKIGCLRLESHVVAFFGSRKDKKKILQKLRHAKATMFQKMNEPLNEADINESIGVVASNLLIINREVTFQQVRQPFKAAIDIRQKLLGPFNKFNARDYTLLVQMISIPELKSQYMQQFQSYFKKGMQIYNRVDFTNDSILILYRMQLESTFFIFSSRQKNACQTIIDHLQKFDQCQNRQVSLEIATQLFRSSGFLSIQLSFAKEGLFWMKKCFKYTVDLEKFVNKTYNMVESDKRKNALLQLKLGILRQICETGTKVRDPQLQVYRTLFEDEKQKANLAQSQRSQ